MVVSTRRLGIGIMLSMHPLTFFLFLATPSGRTAFDLSHAPLQPTALPFSPRHPLITTDAFAQGHVPLVCLPLDALGLLPHTLAACKLDALSLQQAGFGAPAGVASQTDGIRSHVHQIWLQSPRPDDPRLSAGDTLQYVMVGQMAARRDLIRWVDSLRQYLVTSRGPAAAPLLAGAVELSYVLYPTGAYYKQHVDQSQTQDSSRRAISFVLYLGDPTSSTKDNDDDDMGGSRPWDCVTDGGALRVYGSTSAAVACTGKTVVCISPLPLPHYLDKYEFCRYYADITPTAGTLVIFDSATVQHEVRTTHRPRAAVVGWFRESSPSPKPDDLSHREALIEYLS